MPVAALIDDKILCMHGGLSPELINYNQINDISKPQEVPDNGNSSIIKYKILKFKTTRFIMWFTLVWPWEGYKRVFRKW